MMQKSIKNVIKTLCLIMTLLFLCQINVVPEIQGTVNVEAASRKTKKNAMNAYKKMLLKNVKWSNGYYARSKELYFTCIDINKDGVKELILYYMDSPHAYGWNRIYTYTDGRVKSLGQFTSVSICTNKKYFTDSYMNGGIGREYFYQLGKNGKKIKIAEYTYADHKPYGVSGFVTRKHENGYPYYYYNCKVNGKRVGYNACMKKVKALKRGAKYSSGNYHKNTAANRKKFIK